MTFGYTPFDPFVVLIGTLYAARLIIVRPVNLIGFLPLALSLYFFIPLISYLTLWRTVPLLLIGRIFVTGRVRLAPAARPVFGALLIFFVLSLLYAFVFGIDTTRTVIRSVFYLSAFSLFLFAYEFGGRPESRDLLLKGLAWTAILYGIYGAYQILAFYTGVLPVRGIVYGPGSTGLIPQENGIPRINSLANEPKRLGYVMFLGALACFTLAAERAGRTKQNYMLAGAGVLGLSVMTFAASYFLAIALFCVAAFILYPVRFQKWMLPGAALVMLALTFGYGQSVFNAIERGYERRVAEVEVGVDGKHVYRQEFFAQDYFENHPWQLVTGVGLGQYYRVLNREYGPGVGYSENGGLAPLNSTPLELTFDLGGIATLLFYGGLAVLILQLRQRGHVFFTLALLFLTLQSLTILTQLFLVMMAGVALAQLRLAPAPRAAPPQPPPVPAPPAPSGPIPVFRALPRPADMLREGPRRG